MKNARILLAVLLLAGLAKVAFSQEAAKKEAVPVVIEEAVIAVVDNGTDVMVEEIDEVEEVMVNAAK